MNLTPAPAPASTAATGSIAATTGSIAPIPLKAYSDVLRGHRCGEMFRPGDGKEIFAQLAVRLAKLETINRTPAMKKEHDDIIAWLRACGAW